jgi:hypothetical protein
MFRLCSSFALCGLPGCFLVLRGVGWGGWWDWDGGGFGAGYVVYSLPCVVGLFAVGGDVAAVVVDDLLGLRIGHVHGVFAAGVGEVAGFGDVDVGGFEVEREGRVGHDRREHGADAVFAGGGGHAGRHEDGVGGVVGDDLVDVFRGVVLVPLGFPIFDGFDVGVVRIRRAGSEDKREYSSSTGEGEFHDSSVEVVLMHGCGAGV